MKRRENLIDHQPGHASQPEDDYCAHEYSVGHERLLPNRNDTGTSLLAAVSTGDRYSDSSSSAPPGTLTLMITPFDDLSEEFLRLALNRRNSRPFPLN